MPAITAIVAWVLANPAIVAAGEAAIKDAIDLVSGAIGLHQAGVLTDAQLAVVWANVGANVQNADDAWAAAKAGK